MIRISQIDSDLSIYKNNTIVLLKKDSLNQDLLKLLKSYQINPDYICDVNNVNWGEMIENIPVISPQHLNHMVKKNNCRTDAIGEIVVQITSQNIGNVLIDRIKSFGIEKIITVDEANQILKFMKKLKKLNEHPYMVSIYEPLSKEGRIIKERIEAFKYLMKNNKFQEHIFICSVQKTGDVTLQNTFNINEIPYYFAVHTPEVLNKELIFNCKQKFKVITGVRDPISQNLSFLYQHISSILGVFSYYLSENCDLFFKDGGDAQILFDKGFGKANGYNNVGYQENFTYINDFFTRFSENIIDLSAYPFDKDKGYTIVKDGNIEVFVYQLERMNDIVKEMSDWIGQTPFDEWKIANEASGKWIANSYKQAQKEITFSQEYFDRCYNDKWIQHFYSQEDIEKFKERWRSHIR